MKLFMIMVGCRPPGRLTEQHDIFFGIGDSLKELLPSIDYFWKEAKGKFHIDAWREVNFVDGFKIEVVAKEVVLENSEKLFFINLGGYKKDEFEEYHYKVLTVANAKSEAIKNAKQTTFFKHCGFNGAISHIDDKYGVDVDEVYLIKDVLAPAFKDNYQLKILKAENMLEDVLHIGYLPTSKV